MGDRKALLIDGFQLERASLRAVLVGGGNFSMVAEAEGLPEAHDLLSLHDFALVICSLVQKGEEHLPFLKKVAHAIDDIPLLVMDYHSRIEHMLHAIHVGAHGYLNKNADQHELLKASDLLLNGRKYFPDTPVPKQIKGVLEGADVTDKAESQILISAREKEILRMVMLGNSNAQIAVQLQISSRTVENHRANIMRKLDVKNTAALVKKVIEMGIVQV